MTTARYILALFAVVACSGWAHAQQVSAAFDSAVVETGRVARLTLTAPAKGSKPEDVDFSDWSGAFPPENILGQSGWKQVGGYWQEEIMLIAFDADTLHLPALRVGFADGSAAATNPLELVVRATPAPEDPNDMADIKNIHKEPARWTDYWHWFAVLGGLLALALVWYFIAVRAQQRKKKQSRQFQAPPHALALRKIRELEQQGYVERGKFAAYYGTLSFILREYLEARFRFPALESVAADILPALREKGVSDTLLVPMEVFLRWSDLAKFAQAEPPAGYHKEALDFVKLCITQTTQPDNPEADTKA